MQPPYDYEGYRDEIITRRDLFSLSKGYLHTAKNAFLDWTVGIIDLEMVFICLKYSWLNFIGMIIGKSLY